MRFLLVPGKERHVKHGRPAGGSEATVERLDRSCLRRLIAPAVNGSRAEEVGQEIKLLLDLSHDVGRHGRVVAVLIAQELARLIDLLGNDTFRVLGGRLEVETDIATARTQQKALNRDSAAPL